MASDLPARPQVSLEYYGRSCFEIRFAGKRIVIDPFNPDMFEYASQDCRYSLPKNKIEYALATHVAPDHSYFEGIDADRTYIACGDKPEFVREFRGEKAHVGGVVAHDFDGRSFSFWTVPSFHDDQQGALEGVNGIICLDFDGLKVVHLGDVGHTLNPEQVEGIGIVDVLMVPVDEYYTIDAETGKRIVEQLEPKIVIPMHYKTDNLAEEPPFSDEKNFVSKFGDVSVLDECCLAIGRASGPAGGIVTNVEDMLNYAEFQLGDGMFNGKRLLEPESLRRLHTPQLQYCPDNSVALTFWVDDSRATRTLSHGGGTVGQASLLTLIPDRDFSILLVTNSGNGGRLNQKVTNWALDHYLGIETPKLAPMEVPQDQLAEYAGSYEAILSAAEVESSGGRLAIRRRSLGGFPTKDIPPPSTEPHPPVRYGFYGEDHIVGLEAPNKSDLGQFLRDPDGSIAWLRLGKRIHRPSDCARATGKKLWGSVDDHA